MVGSFLCPFKLIARAFPQRYNARANKNLRKKYALFLSFLR